MITPPLAFSPGGRSKATTITPPSRRWRDAPEKKQSNGVRDRAAGERPRALGAGFGRRAGQGTLSLPT